MERKECRCGQLRIANTDDGRVLQWENYQKYWVIIDMEPGKVVRCQCGESLQMDGARRILVCEPEVV